MRPLRRQSVCALLLLGALWFPDTRTHSASPPPLRLFDLTTAHGIVNDQPVQPATVFAPDDPVISVWYAAEGCAIGTMIQSTWLYLETDPPSRLREGAVTVDRDGEWGQFNFTLAEGRRWAPGRYRIELRIDHVLTADTEFVVSPTTSRH